MAGHARWTDIKKRKEEREAALRLSLDDQEQLGLEAMGDTMPSSSERDEQLYELRAWDAFQKKIAMATNETLSWAELRNLLNRVEGKDFVMVGNEILHRVRQQRRVAKPDHTPVVDVQKMTLGELFNAHRTVPTSTEASVFAKEITRRTQVQAPDPVRQDLANALLQAQSNARLEPRDFENSLSWLIIAVEKLAAMCGVVVKQ